MSIRDISEYDFDAVNSPESEKINVNSPTNVEENSFSFYESISYFIDNSLYYDPTAFRGVIRNPGDNSYALCALAEGLYNENGFYSNEINRIVSNTGIVHIISPLKGDDESAHKFKEEFIDFNNEVELDFVALDMLFDTQKFGVYFGYLEYSRDKKDKRVLRLPPKYMKIFGNDGVSPIIGINLYTVSTKDKINLFPASLRAKIKSAQKRIIKKGTGNLKNDEVYNSEDFEYLKNQFLKIDKRRSIAVINGDTRSVDWGQIPLIKSLDQIATNLKIEDKIREAVRKGDRNVLVDVLPGNDQKAANVRMKNVSLGKKAASEQHTAVKAAAQSYDATTALTLAGGSTIQVVNIKDMFSNYDSGNSVSRMTFNAGVPEELVTGKAEGSAIANYMKNALSVIHVNLFKFSVEASKVFHAFKGKDKKIVKLSYVKVNDYIVKDSAAMAGKLFTEAGGSYEEYIASTGRDPHTYINQMRQERKMEYDKLFEPHLTANNISKDDQLVTGRGNGDEVE